MCQKIAVGMGEMKIAEHPNSLAAYGVGSCVIIFMYDSKTKRGGGVHAVLPDSHGLDYEKINPNKFCDTAIPLLFDTLSKKKIYKSSVWAKIIGGAEMFPPTEDFSSSVGKYNAEAAKEALKKLGIPLIAEDIGGSRGRTVELDLDTGIAIISVIGEEVKEL